MLPPASMHLTMALKLLPPRIFDAILDLAGARDVMDSFVGRGA